MTIPCPHCGEPVDSEDAKWLDVKLGPDPLAHVFRRLNVTGYFSNENQQTVAKPEPQGLRYRGRFNRRSKP